jgi:hypothetical protein
MTTLTKSERKAEFERMGREAGELMHTSFLAGCPKDAPSAAIREHVEQSRLAEMPVRAGQASHVAPSYRGVANKFKRIELPPRSARFEPVAADPTR